jgi:hypothetical protein
MHHIIGDDDGAARQGKGIRADERIAKLQPIVALQRQAATQPIKTFPDMVLRILLKVRGFKPSTVVQPDQGLLTYRLLSFDWYVGGNTLRDRG